MAERGVIRLRSAEQVERVAVALVREEAAFDVRPEANGWWVIRVTTKPGLSLYEVQHVAQSTRRLDG
jgi:hypothetical protein